MSHIFISYSRADKVCAYKIQRQLEAQGFKVWIDKNAIAAGAPFPVEILHAIRNADAVFILWSKNAEKSHFVGKEIEEALNQRMIRSLPVIPVWLDNTPLPTELAPLNAVKLQKCADHKADPQIDNLIHKLPISPYRRLFDFDPNKPLANQGAVPLQQISGLSSLPIMESVFCKGRIIASPNLMLEDVKSHKTKTVQVFLEFLGTVGSEEGIKKIHENLQASQKNTPFFLFHFTGHEIASNYSLVDDPGDSPAGDWLDPVNAIYMTLEKLVGRGGATLQLFNAAPVSLGFALGMRFYNFWHVQLYHFTRNKQYQFVLDTNDL